MNLKKQITKTITNQLDKPATHIEITGINEEDKAIFCNLYSDEKLLVNGRVYSFDNFPCESLNHGEIELIKGNDPTDKWYVDEIKLWLDAKQVKDADGNISKDDPYYYPTDALKAELLKLTKTD